MDRRRFLRDAILTTLGGATLPSVAVAAAGAQTAETAETGESPYGPLRAEPDENGLLLPEGFTSRIIGVAGEPVGPTTYPWHAFPDGAATFAAPDGGWILAVNSEVFSADTPTPSGGASAVRFGADGEITDAYRILENSHSNCAGGPTPWGTWLSCEEDSMEMGLVYECDPTGESPAVAHEAMGRWAHEAVAVDPDSETLYLTEDHPAGLLYRYTPRSYPDLSGGSLEACLVATDGAVSWQTVPDPSAATAPTRNQVPGARVFPGGEGIWSHDGSIYFTSKVDHSVHTIDLRSQRYSLIWQGDPDRLGVEGAVLSGVDNITVDEGSGDLVVAEDGGNMELVVITPDGAVAPFARIVAPRHEESEVTGPCFNPSRHRLYFSSQRGPSPKAVSDIIPGYTATGSNGGVTFEVTGPFRGRAEVATTTTTPSPVTTIAQATNASESDDGPGSAVLIGGGAVALAAAAGLVAMRRRQVSSAARTDLGGRLTSGRATSPSSGLSAPRPRLRAPRVGASGRGPTRSADTSSQ